MQLRQFIVSRTHATFAEVRESVKTFQELIEVDTVLHVFKNVTFGDARCTFCNESLKSLDCPSLRSIKWKCPVLPVQMTVVVVMIYAHVYYDYGSHRCLYLHRSRSTSRSPRHFDRGYSPEIDYSHGRDYCYCSPDINNGRDYCY